MTEGLDEFLRQVGRVPLLTGAEEVALAKRIEKGDLDAKARMVEANLRLAIHVAKRYRGLGLEFVDLIQEGVIGLMRAAELFDWRKGFRFSTYAMVWTKQGIQRALQDKSRAIRLPAHRASLDLRVHIVEGILTKRLGGTPTVAEIAAEMGISVADVKDIKQASRVVASLNKQLGDEDGSEFGDLLSDQNTPSPFELAAEALKRDAVLAALERLSYRERRVLALRFGLEDDDRPRTLDEVSAGFHITRERARQIEKAALAKLRNRASARPLQEFAA